MQPHGELQQAQLLGCQVLNEAHLVDGCSFALELFELLAYANDLHIKSQLF